MVTIPAVSVTMRSEWRACPRRVFFRWVAGLEMTRDPGARVVGKAFHLGLETFRRGGSIDEAVSVAASAAGGMTSLDGVQVGAYVAAYVTSFRDDKVLAVEAPVFGDDDAEKGYADAIVELDGTPWLVEDKTTSVWLPPETVAMALRQDDQLATYVGQIRAAGIPVAGALYRQVRKATIRPRTGEDLAGYAARLGDAYGPESGAIREIVVAISERDVEVSTAHREAVNAATRAQLAVPEFERWPWNPASCIGRFGACEYLHLCATGADSTDRAFKPGKDPLDGGIYRQRIWNLGRAQCASGATGGDAALFGDA